MAKDEQTRSATIVPGLKVKCDVEEGLSADASQGLVAIGLENLLLNAWKFTSKSISPQVAVGRVTKDAEDVFFVRDNGAGFPSEQASRLFHPFSRLHASSEFSGTGLGLATVARIIQRHEGRIWAEGRPGEGATFWFTLKGREPSNRV